MLRGTIDWLFIIGLILPAAYVAISPGIYFTIWYQIITSINASGVTVIVLFVGVLKALLYGIRLLSSKNTESYKRIEDLMFIIHMGVAVFVSLLMISWILIKFPSIELVIRLSLAVLITEFMLFPLIGVLHLQDMIRRRKVDIESALLSSIAIYICIALLTASHSVQVISTELTILEAAGERLISLLIFFVILISRSIFWEGFSLYSLDIAPPPVWIGGFYVTTLALFLYYYGHYSSDIKSRLNSHPYTPKQLDTPRVVTTILIAAVLAFLTASASDLLLPRNMVGRMLQLFIVLATLLLLFIAKVQVQGERIL